MLTLTEDEIDDILYLARSNEADELTNFLTTLATQYSSSKRDLIATAVDPESKNTALHYAAANGHTDILTLLAQSAISPTDEEPIPQHLNSENAAGNTPLHWAALNGHLPFVQALVRLGADASRVNAAGHDAVFEAELNDKGKVVDWLLEEAEGLDQAVKGADDEDNEREVDNQRQQDLVSGAGDEDNGREAESQRQQDLVSGSGSSTFSGTSTLSGTSTFGSTSTLVDEVGENVATLELNRVGH